MAHDKNSTWNRQIWDPQKMVPYKNGTPCETMPKGYPVYHKDWAEWFLKGSS